MPPVPDATRRRTILIIWFAMTFSVVIYGFLAYTLGRSPGRANLKDPLTGPLGYLPYALPILLLVIGGSVYNAVALRGAGPGKASWGAIQTGFIGMLAIFEANVLVGLAFFFLGAPLDKFQLFAVGTLILNAIGLRRLLATWPRP